MSTTFGTPATAGGWIPRGSRLIDNLKSLWTTHLIRRIERAAIIQLHAMSDRELQDIGLTRSQIEWAVKGERDKEPFSATSDDARHCRSEIERRPVQRWSAPQSWRAATHR